CQCSGIEAQWGDSSFRTYPFIRNPYGNGWHISHSQFLTEFRRLAERSCVRRWSDTVSLIRREQEHWSLRLSSGRELSCDFVVDASGRRGVVATQLTVRRVRHDGLVAVGS